ncbi:rhamnogalacturonan acetylesterase RgaE [Rickenella mellea]|uniref:Rhamnogalacturonan acetylesterase RgaE n=1 Tax=Rickenella mellea TaxID=50990 RepID=A0A4Y7PM75_9AGAM|nr:rhamnogalacturonan acetylesterase RgaE [Rickenella mellea]
MLVRNVAAAFLSLYVALCKAGTTLWLVGDSTMAKGGGGGGTDGWGQYIPSFFDIPIINNAIAGTSARSYTTKGFFDRLFGTVQSGDWVVIEFGHNDGHSDPDNGTSDCVGDDVDTTCIFVDNGQNVTVHTYNFYIQNAINTLASLGVKTVVSSVTPDNIWPLGPGTGDRFVGYASLAASRTGADYVDHYDYVVEAFEALGEPEVNTFFPNNQHLHTSPAGAAVVAQAFVKGLSCGTSELTSHLTSAASDIPNDCLVGL